VATGNKKLKIVRGKKTGSSVEFDESEAANVLNLPFNPTDYSIEKKNNFASAAIPGLESPIIQYASGDARVLSLEVMLDSYTYGQQQDLRDLYLATIDRFLAIDEELHAPPPCKVIWGSLQFVGVLENVKKQFVLFLDNGTPVRARVTFSFREYIPVEVQVRETPVSSPDRYKLRTVKQGEALWHIAADAYGDPRMWKVLANANGLDDPFRLRTGSELLIPKFDHSRGERDGS
jgi:hypothetical protein